MSVTGVLDVAPVAVEVITTELEPAGIVTEVGTGRSVELLDRATVMPPVGAGALRVVVMVTLAPLTTEPGLAARAISTGAFTVKVAVLVTEARVAVMVTVAFDRTGTVENVADAELEPEGTVSVVPEGMVVPSELEREMT